MTLYYYPEIRVRLKAGFVREAIPAYAIHGKRIFPETARRCAGRRFEIGQNQIWTVGEPSLLNIEIDRQSSAG
jgi:hypothetical protein